MGGLLSLCREAIFFIIFPYVHVRDEKSFGHSKIELDSKLDTKFENSKLGRVRCKISLKFVSFSKVIIYV